MLVLPQKCHQVVEFVLWPTDLTEHDTTIVSFLRVNLSRTDEAHPADSQCSNWTVWRVFSGWQRQPPPSPWRWCGLDSWVQLSPASPVPASEWLKTGRSVSAWADGPRWCSDWMHRHGHKSVWQPHQITQDSGAPSSPGFKTHIKEPISFIQNQHFQTPHWTGQVQTVCFPLEHVLQTSWSGNYNVGSETHESATKTPWSWLCYGMFKRSFGWIYS